MALNEVFDVLYIVDRQLIEEYGELGSDIAKTMTNNLTLRCPCYVEFLSVLI